MALSLFGSSMRSMMAGVAQAWQVETIEASNFYHVLPGSKVVRIGLSRCGEELASGAQAWTPWNITQLAELHGIQNVGFGDLERLILAESFVDVVEAFQQDGIGVLISSAGIMPAESRNECFQGVKAVNLDLKGFTDAFYVQQTGSQLRPVLETLLHLYHENDCWLEITTCLISGLNDHPVEIDAMTKWLVKHLGHDVPLHLTTHDANGPFEAAFSPSAAMLRRAQTIAKTNGLSHVYIDHPGCHDGSNTGCDCCGRTLIVRQAGKLLRNDLMERNQCPSCGMKLEGRFLESFWSPTAIRGNRKSSEAFQKSLGERFRGGDGSAPFR
jgi:pyruvate formate lyase activating enzyme